MTKISKELEDWISRLKTDKATPDDLTPAVVKARVIEVGRLRAALSGRPGGLMETGANEDYYYIGRDPDFKEPNAVYNKWRRYNNDQLWSAIFAVNNLFERETISVESLRYCLPDKAELEAWRKLAEADKESVKSESAEDKKEEPPAEHRNKPGM